MPKTNKNEKKQKDEKKISSKSSVKKKSQNLKPEKNADGTKATNKKVKVKKTSVKKTTAKKRTTKGTVAKKAAKKAIDPTSDTKTQAPQIADSRDETVVSIERNTKSDLYDLKESDQKSQVAATASAAKKPSRWPLVAMLLLFIVAAVGMIRHWSYQADNSVAAGQGEKPATAQNSTENGTAAPEDGFSIDRVTAYFSSAAESIEMMLNSDEKETGAADTDQFSEKPSIVARTFSGMKSLLGMEEDSDESADVQSESTVGLNDDEQNPSVGVGVSSRDLAGSPVSDAIGSANPASDQPSPAQQMAPPYYWAYVYARQPYPYYYAPYPYNPYYPRMQTIPPESGRVVR